jgi:predicted molibdopterin-dependent oxidoreductase YjgC
VALASRIEGKVERPAPVEFTLDGRKVGGVPGESLAAALMAAGIIDLRTSPLAGSSRGIFCMMGICQECLVRVDGRCVVACLEPLRAGMNVELSAAAAPAHG